MEREKYSEEREFRTSSGISIKSTYRPEDLKIFDYKEKLGDPGEFPYTRGIHKEMYRKRLWTMREYAGFGSGEETNKRFLYLISLGQTGLSLAFDLPTQLGYDSDHPLSQGEVGRTGVAISQLDDLRIVFRNIDLSSISTSMTINATANILLSMYILLAEENGLDYSILRGTVQNDILKEFTARGNYIYPVEPSIKLAVDIIEFTSKFMPKWNPISVSGYHYREAGATAVEEVAFTFANAICYIEETLKRGINIDEFAPRISFFFACHNDFFEEIAKFRAARRIWAKIMKNRYKAKNENSMKLRFHTQTSGVSLTLQEPMNNLIRVAYQALAAVLGGTQSLHTNSFDEAIGLPTEKAVKLALRTQQILAYETNIPSTCDPLGGSYFVESLTNELEEKILSILEEIDKLGGAIEATLSGYYSRKIQESSYEFQKKLESGEIKIVGVNFLREKVVEQDEIKPFVVNPEIEEEQVRRLKAFKMSRDSKDVLSSLDELKSSATKNENLMPKIIYCVKSGATLGEISDVLREVYGEYQEVTSYWYSR